MAGHRERLLDDDDWKEVTYINSYAVFMGYLSMAIKGLGFLVLTWTTVVLLGGFVSMLQKKDFWSLTFITLVQTAGIFDVTLNERLGYMKNSVLGLIFGVASGVMGESRETWGTLARLLFASVLVLVQVLVFAAVLCPLAMIYVFGILISGGISLWRLIQHDYGGNSDGEANLAPAMDTLYYLAVIQAAIFCYKFILGSSEKKLANHVDLKCNDTEQRQVLHNYLRETKNGCEQDPSFAKGRNLVTHAVDMIGSGSPVDCISGVKILYTTICIVERQMKELEGQKGSQDYLSQSLVVYGQRMLMKHLIVSASSSRHILKKLLETLDSKGVHDRDTRHQAAMVVERLAFSIKLEEFPRGIQHISSLIETFDQYSIVEPFELDNLYDEYDQLWKFQVTRQTPSPAGELGKAYKELLLQGLRILKKLAADKNNCRVLSNTGGVVSKTMAPLTSDLLHHTTDDHGAWSDVVMESMNVICRLTGPLGETGAKLRREVAICEEAINTLWRILNCNKCNEGLQQKAIWILSRLYMDTESSRSAVLQKENHSKEDFVRMLVGIFTHDNKYSFSIRAYVGGALSVLCFHGGIGDATIVIQTGGGDVVNGLTKVLVHDRNEICRQQAAEILEHLCTHYTNDDEYLGKLKNAMTGAIPEVLGEILRCGEEAHNGKQSEQEEIAKPKADIENQCHNGSSSSSHPQNDEQVEEKVLQATVQSVCSATLLSSLLLLCGTVYATFTGELGPDFPTQLDASNLLNKLKEMVVTKTDLTIVNLLLFKAISKMVISMIKHNESMFVKEDLQSLIDALSSASKNMQNRDNSMIFSSTDDTSAPTGWKLNKHTLASHVKEAQDLHTRLPSPSVSG